ncbi:hypothetical protein A5906_18560 [Bradyrhizobium sacchari]|uniref:Uncharacterized protein DUF3618 n=1 Tax=Bradyrhizobium sacchari TaxID=1399419 RepID=A0A560KC97_9BRAD|nr:hypothetical protein A5906_18560 [Bradyrhizobium sacchari]TWB64619.1 uncharacterized protein DUF3618 [Bradyrhizobium sacchari]TWB80943.1 uncharacterized protein DUF3618 [Bradyrhizobium sacchari]
MTRSVEELRRESERNRAELAATVERLKQGISDTTRDLRYMVSPQHVKSEMSGCDREASFSEVRKSLGLDQVNLP